MVTESDLIARVGNSVLCCGKVSAKAISRLRLVQDTPAHALTHFARSWR